MKSKYGTYAAAQAAAQRLGFGTMQEYNKGYWQDPKLPSVPHSFYAEDWVDTYDFLGTERPPEKYATLAESQAAAQKLGVSGKEQYKRGYRQDPKLPSNPNITYSDDWVGWPEFLGLEQRAEKYATLAEAQEAAQRLGFSSFTEYEQGYQEDPRLPRSPKRSYVEEWLDWYDFLGVERPAERYATLVEAGEAAQRLGFLSSSEYKKSYQQDPKLPSMPSQFYAEDWVDWYDFLSIERPAERYATLAEARKAAQRLGLSSFSEYKMRYRQDPKLPSIPNRYYSEDWVDWGDFLGFEQVERYATLASASEAAQRLAFSSIEEYTKGYQNDPKLPGSPNVFYAEDWVDWYDFLGKERPIEKYATLADAQEAVQRLGFSSSSDYKKGYKQDPKLPAMPFGFYAADWVDWFDFLGTVRPADNYATLAEAREAAQGLGFSSSSEYNKGYQRDPLLPANPNHTYAENWVDWYDFLGTERPDENYATLAEAQQAAQRMGFSSKSEYQKGYQQDPKLPGKPRNVYTRDWVNWYDFLGKERPTEKYATLDEASQTAQRLGFGTMDEYKKGYQKDPRLPGTPYHYYAEEWVSWPKFLGNEKAFDPELLAVYPRFWAAIQAFIEAGVNQTSKTTHLRAFLKEVVAAQNLPDDPGAILSKEIPFNERVYVAFVDSTGETRRRPRHNVCMSFLDWVLDAYCSDEDDEGVLTPIPGYRNPLRTVLKGYLDQLPTWKRSESNKPPLPITSILRTKKHLIPSEAQSFRDLYSLHPFLRDCWFEVDPEVVDESDPNCVFRQVTKDRKKADGERYFEDVTELWSPVKIVANYALFSMPLRGQQILWLDSGEGDEIIPVWRDGGVRWIKNPSHLARSKRNQGFLRRGEDGELSSCITTNKTGHRDGGYIVPYMPDELGYWVIQLREWQSKYNPIDELTPWTKIKRRQKINQNILKRRGRQAFLFRDPCSTACDAKVSPMFTTTAFTRTIPALLFHSQMPGEDLAEKVQKKITFEYRSEFTAHSLRVSLITAYIVDGRAPIHVISKLVGHASLVMTIYYTKVGHAHMRRELADAEKRALERNVEHLQDLILQKKINQARSELIATDRTFMDQCISSDWPAAAYQWMSIGICPMGGAKCDEGGEQLVERKTEKVYGPVPSGYLGARNCPRCRFLLSGPAFLGGLSAIANEVILEISVVRAEYHELETQRQALDDERYEVERAGHVFKNESKLKKVTAAYEEKAKKLDTLLGDFQHLYRLISQSTDLLNKAEAEKNQLIVSDQFVEIDMHLAEQQSEFRLLAEVCANAEIYESASAARAKPLLTQMLDKLADTNGIVPSMFRLSEKQQLRAANQVVRLIMQTTQNDWHLADQLVNGRIMLEDLAETAGIGDLHKEIESMMHGSLKAPRTLENRDE